jgi:hypothetical protein
MPSNPRSPRRTAACEASALAVLWPADRTRYDIATLGNRQALVAFLLGLLATLCRAALQDPPTGRRACIHHFTAYLRCAWL